MAGRWLASHWGELGAEKRLDLLGFQVTDQGHTVEAALEHTPATKKFWRIDFIPLFRYFCPDIWRKRRKWRRASTTGYVRSRNVTAL